MKKNARTGHDRFAPLSDDDLDLASGGAGGFDPFAMIFGGGQGVSANQAISNFFGRGSSSSNGSGGFFGNLFGRSEESRSDGITELGRADSFDLEDRSLGSAMDPTGEMRTNNSLSSGELGAGTMGRMFGSGGESERIESLGSSGDRSSFEDSPGIQFDGNDSSFGSTAFAENDSGFGSESGFGSDTSFADASLGDSSFDDSSFA